MENVKLFKILRTFSPIEFNDFGEFVHSICFNKSEKLVSLYEYLKPHHPNFLKSTELNKEKLFELMYPGENFNDKKLRDRLSLMYKLAENYLINLELQKNYLDKKIMLMRQLRERKLEDLYEMEIENVITYIEKFSKRSDDYYWRKYTIDNLKRTHLESKIQTGKYMPVYDYLILENEDLFLYLVVSLLKNAIKIKTTEGTIKVNAKTQIYDWVIDYVEKNLDKFKDIPVIQVLFRFLNLYKKKFDLKSYKELNKLLKENKNIFKTYDYSLLYLELYNYCKEKQAQGEKKFGVLSFEIMKDMLSKELMYEDDGYMHPHNYINITATAIRIGELLWAENFIITYKNKMRPELTENAYNYSYATFYHVKGMRDSKNRNEHYEKCLSHLANVKKEDYYYYTRLMNIEITIHYELGNTEKCIYLNDSFKKFLFKNKLLPKDVSVRNINFANFFQKLIKAKNKGDKTALGMLKDEIQNNPEIIAYKEWLIRQINELI